MACIPVPPFPTPPLPGFAITAPPLPPFPGVDLCCKLDPFAIPVPPISFGVAVPASVLATINAAEEQIETYLSALPLKCPKL